MFYSEVDYYKTLWGNDMKEQAQTILETYCLLGAPFEINIQSSIRSKLSQDLKDNKITKDLFDQAIEEVKYFMESESYPRFVGHNLYKNFVKNDLKSKDKN
jgi:hypothetical protein